MASALAAEEITGGIKDLLSVDVKSRHDSIPDQYSRIFMVRLLLVCTIIIGVNEYKDTISCIIPQTLEICGDSDDQSCRFVNGACWVQGMYVYKQLIGKIYSSLKFLRNRRVTEAVGAPRELLSGDPVAIWIFWNPAADLPTSWLFATYFDF